MKIQFFLGVTEIHQEMVRQFPSTRLQAGTLGAADDEDYTYMSTNM